MPDHLKLTAVLAILRAVAGLGLAAFLFWKVQIGGLPPGHTWDAHIFLALAGACFALAHLRLVLALGALRCWSWTRRLGVGLAVFDCANLIFFPLSTALGLQGFVSYRHSETIHYFRRPPGKRRARP